MDAKDYNKKHIDRVAEIDEIIKNAKNGWLLIELKKIKEKFERHKRYKVTAHGQYLSEQKKMICQRKSKAKARNNCSNWTLKDIKILTETKETDYELALMLGRTHKAVAAKRQKLNKEISSG